MAAGAGPCAGPFSRFPIAFAAADGVKSPTMTDNPPAIVSNRDREQLKLLEIFHYVLMGLSVLYIAFLCMHYMMMSTVFSNPHMFDNAKQKPPFDPVQFFHIFIWFYIFAGAWGVLSICANLASALCLHNRKNRMVSLVVAGFNCISVPFGTALGICAIIVLVRPSVIALYQKPPPSL